MCMVLQLAVPDVPGVADVWRLHWEAELVRLDSDMEVNGCKWMYVVFLNLDFLEEITLLVLLPKALLGSKAVFFRQISSRFVIIKKAGGLFF